MSAKSDRFDLNRSNDEIASIEALVAILSDEEVDQRLSEMSETWQEVIRKTIPADRRGLLIDIYYVSLP